MNLTLSLLPGVYAVCQLSSDAPIPDWAKSEELLAFVRTDEELSVICEQNKIPADVRAERNWRALKVRGPLEFSLVGVLASLATTLAEVGVSIFVVSTFNTDYILLKRNQLDIAVTALRKAGHSLVSSG